LESNLSDPPSAPPTVFPPFEVYPDTDEDSPAAAPKFLFPPDFLFGAATSSHQVEGNCTNNDWWAWEQAGKVPEKSGLACDHYRRFREDFDLARELRHNAHRFSIEWSRIEPEEGRFSDDAIRHYRDVLSALRERGMEPIVTLHHFTLPQWLAAKGGWENPKIEGLFARYVGVVVDACKDLARWWITINEPLVIVFKGYVIGEWPPGKKEFPVAMKVVRQLLRTHVRAYHVIHERQPDARVSIAHHALALSADDKSRLRDRLSLGTRSFLVNHMFLKALVNGHLRVPGVIWEGLGSGRTLDFLGLNYYTRDFVRNAGFDLAGLLGSGSRIDHRMSIGQRNELGWEIYPEGMGRLLGEYGRYGLPVLISENGTSTWRDQSRWLFIYMHLWQVARGLSEGVPIVGYLYWSLLDNFEWAEGYKARFGLVEVDYATQQRRVRPSALHFREVIRRNRL
jgi:beta-glucosidase